MPGAPGHSELGISAQPCPRSAERCCSPRIQSHSGAMENAESTEEEQPTVGNESAEPGAESAAEEQHMDFSTEIMSVTEMEQSPDSSPDLNEDNTQESEIPNIESLQTTDIEADFPPDFDKFWKVVEDNPQDFTGWVYLLQYVEQENHLPAARKAFDRFFSHYPYCYGYWKKYADLEKRHDNVKQSDEVRRARGQRCHQSQSHQ